MTRDQRIAPKATRLGIMDASWLYMEAEGTPAHVGALLTFAKPADAAPTYLRDLVARFRAADEIVAPWNLKLRPGLASKAVPAWVVDDNVDIDYHFRHSALPAPGGERELGVLVSRLHSIELDPRRPLWEIHLIEGLEDDRFALYFKLHHSVVDGVSGIRMLLRSMSTSPTDRGIAPPWTLGRARTVRPAAAPSPARAPRGGALVAVRRAAADLTRALGRRPAADGRTLPYQSPSSVLSVPLTAQRRFATQQVPMSQIKSLAAAADCTVNDVVLWLCSTALRRFLIDADALPTASLTTAIPVSTRETNEDSVGTSIAWMYATLGTATADGRTRLDEIIRSSTAAKAHLTSLPKGGALPYALLSSAPFMIAQFLRTDGGIPPMFSVAISNVPGPKDAHYLDGARLQAIYPISMLMRRGALNITCVSYAGTLNFGFIGARDALPHLQHLAVYVGDAVAELEALLASTPLAMGHRTTNEKVMT